MTGTNEALDNPEIHEEWGVYHTECVVCHKSIAVVAPTHAVQYGYAEVLPHDELICAECGGTEHAMAVTEAIES